ncbi:MAG: alternative ribosome rescue aminoacyl-tRNA hydrolase ArfB [Bacteroidota bacterium]
MIEITPSFFIDESELQFSFVRSSGPGGQNVNKVATAVQLRFDVNRSSLPLEVKERLRRLVGNRLTGEGVLLIEAKRYRTQEQNREDALTRFVELLQHAFKKPRARTKTAPTKASKEKRLKAKKQRSEVKQMRQNKEW